VTSALQKHQNPQEMAHGAQADKEVPDHMEETLLFFCVKKRARRIADTAAEYQRLHPDARVADEERRDEYYRPAHDKVDRKRYFRDPAFGNGFI